MTADIATILTEVKALIDTPEKWTKGSYARNAFGGQVADSSPQAVCFCVLGAVWRAVPGYDSVDDSELRIAAVEALAQWIPRNSLVLNLSDYNDAPTTTHADVMNLFDRAIASCGEVTP